MRELCNVVMSVPGHVGRLVFGSVAGVDVVVMQGRIHSYEHHSMWQVHCDACAHHLYYLQNFVFSPFRSIGDHSVIYVCSEMFRMMVISGLRVN